MTADRWKACLILAGLICLGMICCAVTADAEGYYTTKKTEERTVEAMCPKTMMQDSCMTCHVMRRGEDGPVFGLQRPEKHAEIDFPYGVSIVQRDDKDVGYFLFDSISPGHLHRMFEFFNAENIVDTIIIEVHSPGGSVFDAWRCVGIMQRWAGRFDVETHLHGMAFSAGFVVFAAGEHRIASKHAQGMTHELRSFAFMEMKTPGGLKDEAKEYAKIQNNINEFLASRSDITVEDLEERIHKKNWWMNGQEMMELGFADAIFGMGK